MKYLKYTQYVYLIVALICIYDGVSKMNMGESPWFSFVIALVGIIMFLFRRKYAKKFEDRARQEDLEQK